MVKGKLRGVPEQKKTLCRRSFNVLKCVAPFALLFLLISFLSLKSWFWPGGCGFGTGDFGVPKFIAFICKDVPGNSVKTITTTKQSAGKTLWDWMSLLGVPLSLAILGFWLQQNQRERAEKFAEEQTARDQLFDLDQQKRAEEISERQLKIAAEETKEEVLQVYFDRLSTLLVDKNLLAIAAKVYAIKAQENVSQQKIEATLQERELLESSVKLIRARTLSILRRFENDSERKTNVIRFLLEANIVSKLKLNLSSCDLSGADLCEVILIKANLSKAYLRGANLSEAKLSGAILRRSNLQRANLNGAFLNKAKLGGAFLNGAFLKGANMSEAFLRGANMSGAFLREANLNRAELSEAFLSEADLSGANLGGANLSYAHLNNANLIGVNLVEANLRGANLSGVELNDTNLNKVNFSEVDLNGADLSEANLSEAKLIGTNLSVAILIKADLSGADLRRAKLSETNFSGANLTGAKFGNNSGLTDTAKADLKARGAIFEDTP